MKINQPAVAGTLESGDVMIRIAPLDTQDIDLQINSSVEKQFGDAIRTTILDVLARYNVRGVQLNVDDKGALDCILRARLEALLARASGIPALPWEDCQRFPLRCNNVKLAPAAACCLCLVPMPRWSATPSSTRLMP